MTTFKFLQFNLYLHDNFYLTNSNNIAEYNCLNFVLLGNQKRYSLLSLVKDHLTSS